MYKIDIDYKHIFNRKLIDMGKFALNDPENGYISFMSTDNPQIEYRYNKHGYRSPEFDGNAKILTLGCSQTHGHGLNQEYIWPELLSKKMNLNYANLATGGDGIQAQVIKAFQYFKEFNNPEYVIGVFPLTRIEMPYVKDKFGKGGPAFDSYQSHDNVNKKFIQQLFLDEIDFTKMAKSPYNGNNILPNEIAIFYNLMFIKMLEQYCYVSGIKFLWSIYDPQGKNINFSELSDSKCYFFDDCFYWHDQSEQPGLDKIDKNSKLYYDKNKNVPNDCHKEYKDNILFNIAADYIYSTTTHRQGHWGIHKHLHIMEKIYDIISS